MQLIQYPMNCCVHSALRQDTLRPRSSGMKYSSSGCLWFYRSATKCVDLPLDWEETPTGGTGVAGSQDSCLLSPALLFLCWWYARAVPTGRKSKPESRHEVLLWPERKTLWEPRVKGSGFVGLSVSETFDLMLGFSRGSLSCCLWAWN